MKTIIEPTRTIAALLFIIAGALNSKAQETNVTPPRVGVYDSRAVAYAHFSTAEHLRHIKELSQAAQAARAAGQTNRFQELAATLRQEQDEIHREVFSTAPATDAMASLAKRIPAIEKEAGVATLVSQWDDQTLNQYRNAEKVDVTARLVREFNPTEKQLKVISGLEKAQPLPPDKCEELIRKGEI